MKPQSILIRAMILAALLFNLVASGSETGQNPAINEYASARIMGNDSSIVWSDGKVVKLVAESGMKWPKEADHRMFWLTVAMNLMSKKGYDFESLLSGLEPQ